MTTHSTTIAKTEAGLGAILVTLFLGAALLFTAGFANSTALHGATHDSRHAISFPCH